MTDSQPDNLDEKYIQNFRVGDKVVRVDAFMMLSSLQLSGKSDQTTNEDLMTAVKTAIIPASAVETLTDQELYALGCRVSLMLKSLGNAFAP
jgi:hypothetical protein